jgi:hypothetical protein
MTIGNRQSSRMSLWAGQSEGDFVTGHGAERRITSDASRHGRLLGTPMSISRMSRAGGGM